MIKRILSLFFVIFLLTSQSEAEPVNTGELSVLLSEKAFYSSPELIIQQFKTNSSNCQNNFILARAQQKKKKLKNALLYYANSCFDKKHSFNIRLFPEPVFRFVNSTNARSIFYTDSIYQIASIFYAYAEHEYVLKFIGLIKNDSSGLYRDAVILKSKSLQKLNRFKEAAEEIKNTIPSYKDNNSQSLLYLRLGAVYESAEDFQSAADSYIDVIKSEGGIWQNSVASKRLLYLITDKKVQLNQIIKQNLFASALYDAKDYYRALPIAEAAFSSSKSPESERLLLKIYTKKNISKAVISCSIMQIFSGKKGTKKKP